MYGMTQKQYLAYQNNIMAQAMNNPKFFYYSGNIVGI